MEEAKQTFAKTLVERWVQLGGDCFTLLGDPYYLQRLTAQVTAALTRPTVLLGPDPYPSTILLLGAVGSRLNSYIGTRGEYGPDMDVGWNATEGDKVALIAPSTAIERIVSTKEKIEKNKAKLEQAVVIFATEEDKETAAKKIPTVKYRALYTIEIGASVSG